MGIVSRSGGSGSGIGALLFDSTLGANAASIDTGANGIALTQNVLDIYIIARTDQAAVFSSFLLTLNNDTGANYDSEVLQGTNVTANAGAPVLAAANWAIECAGASQPASYFSACYITLPAYAQTTAQKSGLAIGSEVGTAAANSAIRVYALNYRATPAITRAKIAIGGGTVFLAGTRLLILGR